MDSRHLIYRRVRRRGGGGIDETMNIDFAQQWRDYVATLNQPSMTVGIELEDDSNAFEFTVDSVEKSAEGLTINARDENGVKRAFTLKATCTESTI
jgi:hypothetical protein